MNSDQEINLIPAFKLSLRYHPVLRYPSASGARAFLHLAAAQARGAELTADLADEGGDWLVLRQDGFCDIEGRMMLRTADGALIYWRARGCLKRADGAGPGDSLRGQLQLQPYFDTANGPYAHMTRSVYLARGQLAGESAEIDVWRLL